MIDTKLVSYTSWSHIYLAIVHNYFIQFVKVQYESKCWRWNTLIIVCGKTSGIGNG